MKLTLTNKNGEVVRSWFVPDEKEDQVRFSEVLGWCDIYENEAEYEEFKELTAKEEA